jgi:hypothetical protein
MGGGRTPHDAKANRITNLYLHGVKFCFFNFKFLNQSMDGFGSFKPVANKIPPQLPTLPTV